MSNRRGPGLVFAWRTSHQMTQLQLALAIGYTTHATLQAWEAGRRKRLPLRRICRLSDVTQIAVEDLTDSKQAAEIALIRGTTGGV